MTRDELRAALAALSSPPPAKVESRGQTFYVRVLTAHDASLMQQAAERHKDARDGCDSGRSLAYLLCDADGATIFDADSADDVLMLSRLHPEVRETLFEAANKANGIDAGNG